MKQDLAIDIKNANVRIGGRDIIHNLDWQVKKGGRCFILGANGAGKTTLVKTLMGYAWPRFGAKVEVLGHLFGQTNLVELRKKIAWVSPFMSQFTNTESTGLEMVLSGFDGTLGLTRKPTSQEIDTAKALMERFRCGHLTDQEIFTMSSGEQVKIMIARALLTKPELVILDEPSVYLDMAGREFLLEEIRQIAEKLPEVTIIFITQRIEDILPIFNEGMILASGRIVEDGERDKVLREDVLSSAYGLPIKLVKNKSGRFWAMLD
ncbi:MAG: ATP-binding cassette domain-containing protein [Victivallales bacterium]|jgi:iron complex transport system ATP-binding protein|nr:ATP-binding cassette domain-containing protein [Victivallales bacterium]